MTGRKIFRLFVLVVWGAVYSIGFFLGLAGAAEIDYPNKVITLINPYAPGGGLDISYQPIVDILPEYLGQKLIVSHKPGAGGAIGTAFAAKAKPDGYTLYMGGVSPVVLIPATRKVSYSYDDFVPLGTFDKIFFVVCVTPDSPWKTLQDLIEAAKKDPGKLKFSSYGVMSVTHVCMEILNHEAGIKTVNIPYTNDSLALSAAIGGHVQFSCNTIQAALPHLLSGTLRALAISDTGRYKHLPGVPTFKELGFNLETFSWHGLMAPKGTPKAIVDKIWNAQKKAFEDNKVQPRLEKIGLIPFLYPPEEMDKIIRADIALYDRVVKTLGLEIK